MNASISAALLMLLLTGGLWLGRRRARPFLRSTDTTAVADLNRAQIERLQALASSAAPASAAPALRGSPATAAGPLPDAVPEPRSSEAKSPALPQEPRERGRCLRRLQMWMRGSREQRLQALAIASLSSRRDVLPLLRLGLRDPDPAVMAAAAAAMARFRGRSAALQPDDPRQPATARLPTQFRRVAGLRPRSVLRTR